MPATQPDWARVAHSINLVASYLALAPSSTHPLISYRGDLDAIVLCPSQVLAQTAQLFGALEQEPGLTRHLVLAGGEGHSTGAIREAVAAALAVFGGGGAVDVNKETTPRAEARIVLALLERCFDRDRVESAGCRVLVEDRSTNCGANAAQARRVLAQDAGLLVPSELLVVQDPTMLRRTVESFVKVYEDVPGLRVRGWAGFVPSVRQEGDGVVFDVPGLEEAELWPMRRFCELLVGEIERLRDDEGGYGPKGRGFIGHVDVPREVDEAAALVADVMGVSR